MPNLRLPPVLLALSVGTLLLSIVPPTAATITPTGCNGGNGADNFEGYTNFFSPPANCLYGVQNVNDVIRTDPIVGATNHIIQGVNGGVNPIKNPCSSTDNPNGNPITYSFRFLNGDPSGIGAADLALVGFAGYAGDGISNIIVALSLNQPGTPGLFVKSGAGTQTVQAFPGAPNLADNTWYEVSLTIDDGAGGGAANCNAASATGLITIAGNMYGTSLGIGNDRPLSLSLGASVINTGPQTITRFGEQFDDLSISGFPGFNPGSRFCARPDLQAGEDGSLDDFGYEYVEGVAFEDGSGFSDPLISLADYFLFEGDSGNNDYMGKGFTTGSTAIATVARIEAAEEGTQSIFRIAYTTGAGGLPSISNKGDGTDGGNFDNNIQARFKEDGNDWVIGIYANVAGAGLNLIGSSVRHGTPDNPSTYNFTVNTVSTLAVVYDGAGNIVLSRAVPAGLQNSVLKDQWFVGSGDSGVFNAQTGLDDTTDSEDNSDSTCIFDLVGTLVVANSQGAAPGSQVPDSPPSSAGCETVLCVDSASVPAGFTADTFNLFLGLIFTTVIAAGGTYATLGENPKGRGVGIAVGVFSLVGYLIALAFGLVPIWPLVVVAIVGLVVLVVKIKGG